MTRVAATALSVQLKSRRVLRNVTFDIDMPGLVAVVGPNGAGKSTLLRAMAGLTAVTDGDVWIGARRLSGMASIERARLIGYLPQERTVHWPQPARAIVALGRLPHRAPGAGLGAADHAAIDTALADLDLLALADRPVLELSGGERARVLIARVLAQQPSVILADEPTSGLDPQHQWALFERLEAAAARGVRIIVALHDLTLASRFAQYMLLIANGQLVACGPPVDVLTRERLADVFGISAARVEHGGHTLLLPTGLTLQSRGARAP